MRQEQVHAERQDGLEEELTQLLDEVRMAEKNVIEMSALSSLFATHVQAQAEQIESLYQDAIESSAFRHGQRGDEENHRAKGKRAALRRVDFARRHARAVVPRLVLGMTRAGSTHSKRVARSIRTITAPHARSILRSRGRFRSFRSPPTPRARCRGPPYPRT